MRCDVAVIGAGAAGIAAAVAAGEAGANVVLVERHGFTGGLATAALVGTICGLFYRHPTTARYAVQGFAREFADAVQTASQSQVATFGEGLHFLPYRPSAFHHVAVRRLQQAGVRIVLQGYVSGVCLSQKRVGELRIQTPAQILSLYPAAVVDCSGGAQISLLAGLDRIRQAHYQAGALVFQVSGLPEIAPDALSLALIRGLKRGIQSGCLDPYCDRLSIIPGSNAQGQTLLKLGMPVPFDGSIGCLSQYELEARERSSNIVDYLSRNEPSLVNLRITAMAAEVGIRTNERSQGLALLDENHVLACRKPDTGVAIGAWPIEYWGEDRKPTLRYFPIDDAYWITAKMLVSCHLDNLFFAGRGLSATEAAIASARVIGTCLSTGYAAGGLAAEFSATGGWQTAVNNIRHRQIMAKNL
ncbi:FAD-dependent oxidoreductase [Methylovulum psychrotolerans]|uniref:FAD-dependent oxidoreductase n=1 Tax=Methylovulum psychrotolerans TaxID=1704499 RepID=A0A2S5CGX5_9GAMM|nr:FAD-dependent oxidoreductase [Methylovulum psychrotolerans]POZ50049.1 hypothetical protein AADEFJLK_04173 [Methylovulum psychrotolerans]